MAVETIEWLVDLPASQKADSMADAYAKVLRRGFAAYHAGDVAEAQAWLEASQVIDREMRKQVAVMEAEQDVAKARAARERHERTRQTWGWGHA